MKLSALGRMCRQLPHDCQLRRLEAVSRLPVMYYRPDTPAPSTFMQVRSMFPVLALGWLLPERAWEEVKAAGYM